MLELNGSYKEELGLKEAKRIPDVGTYPDAAKDEAETFWKEVFNAKQSQTEVSIDDEDIFSKIFGRNENEFEFDIDTIEPELEDLLARFDSDTWFEMTVDEKIEHISKFMDVIADKLDLKSMPRLVFFDGSEDNCGAFNPQENVIKINKSLLDNPKELVNTVAHEMRHAYQNMRADMGETFIDLLYALNFENYISPVPIGNGKFLFFMDYEDQLVEAEARAFAKMFC